jgi:hypothetical protein
LVGVVVRAGERVTLPLRPGLDIRARQFSAWKTGVLAGGIGAVAGALVYAFIRQGTPQTNTFCTIDEGHNQFCLP